MEMLYNPELMPEEEIKQTFVARQPLVDEIVTLIERQPKGAGMQHLVIIAPRGMGKTTVLLMVKFAIKDCGLAEKWQAVKFPEESYSIYDLADFWVETLNLLATETQDNDLSAVTEKLKTKYPNSDDLQEAAYATLKDWHKKHRKRLVLLVENFDQILEQINDERDNARLRDVLMNDGAVMLIGGATTFFKEARAYDQPLYNFFKIYNLADLKFEQMQELMRQRAEIDGIHNFEEKLQANRSRIRALEYFTGGNPRLVLMLYRVVTKSGISEVQRALEKLLDEVTPYYKHKIEILPPQQRKILDHIARISSQTREGVTPGEIATAVRLSPNQVSAQLKRLSELDYVRAANLRGRSSYYTLSEPLYAIWHQMRFGRGVRERMSWLINCLRALYDEDEIVAEGEKLKVRFRDHLSANRLREARDVLEHQLYLADAIGNSPECKSIIESVLSGFGELSTIAITEGKTEEALQYLNQILDINPNDQNGLIACGIVLLLLGRYESAMDSFERALQINTDSDNSSKWVVQGICSLFLFVNFALQRKLSEARQMWDATTQAGRKSGINGWTEVESGILLRIAKDGQLQFARDLITESGLEEQEFPLARAIDYLLTGDEALIEKLSPEVRGVVEEIVARLRPAQSKASAVKKRKGSGK